MNAFVASLLFFVSFCIAWPHANGQERDRIALIVPQRPLIDRVVRESSVEITRMDAQVRINGNYAETSLEVAVKNPGAAEVQAELLFPVPRDAVFKGFSYGERAGQYPARLLSAEEARRLYDSIVARRLDPALLEFAGMGLVRTSVFPIAPRSTMKLRMVYEEVLNPEGGSYRYVLPRSEEQSGKTEWNINVELDSISSELVFCPTHEVRIVPMSSGGTAVSLQKKGLINSGNFQLTWSAGNDPDGTVRIYACPDRERPSQGYFLLLYGAGEEVDTAKQIKREITLVIDRSGSMRGEKMDQVKEAARIILKSMKEGEAFNIITYNEHVDCFSSVPVDKSERSIKDGLSWIEGLQARGGTNISEALETALAQPVREGTLPLVLFLTDGWPTIGEKSENRIIELAKRKNKGERRIFTFGVGQDLNAPLLAGLAEDSRAVPTYIYPHDDVSREVLKLYGKLQGPRLTDVKVTFLSEDGSLAAGRTRDRIPVSLPDVYAGEPLMLLGQYVGEDPIKVVLEGREGRDSVKKELIFHPLKDSSFKNDYVPRLWAMRKVGELARMLQKMEADNAGAGIANDRRYKEIRDEMINLSLEFGILTQFASFFADDGSVSSIGPRRTHELELDDFRSRMGRLSSSASFREESLAQADNLTANLNSKTLNKSNTFKTSEGKEASIDNVRQISQNAYYRVGGIWVENTLKEEKSAEPGLKARYGRVVELGTPEYRVVVDQLVSEGRQAVLALDGDINLQLKDEFILLKNTPQQ